MADWVSIGTLLAVLTPLVGVPLTAVTFYLRGLREQYAGKAAELLTRVDRLDGLADMLVQRIAELHRDCTSREEWIRESMLARRERRVLTKAVVRLQTQLQSLNGGGLVVRLDRAAQATLTAAQRLDRTSEALTGALTPPEELSED